MSVSTAAASSPVVERTNLSQVARRYGIAAVFVALVVAMCIASPQFRTEANAINLLRQNAVIGIMACAMTFAIVLGGFDLSVGAVAAAASVVAAKIMIGVSGDSVFSGQDVVLGLLGAVGVGLAVGLLNGVLIAHVGVNPFVSTLGTMTVLRGLIYVWTNATPLFGVPFGFTEVGLGKTLGIPNPFWIFLAIAVVLIVLLGQTRFGHYVYAIGGNALAAREMGINVRRVRLLVYAITGVCAAVAGIILVGQTATGQPAGALGYELTAIAAVIVGGASLSGGQGTIPNTIVGVFLLGVVSNALNLFGVSPFWQPVATGTILVIAVAIDSAAARSVSSR
ncbi:MAG: ribose transport system permease protein [Thermomicrobiales bacterium]|nr:ribose transport system permease protein [Thermomicrobiales bacterium]